MVGLPLVAVDVVGDVSGGWHMLSVDIDFQDGRYLGLSSFSDLSVVFAAPDVVDVSGSWFNTACSVVPLEFAAVDGVEGLLGFVDCCG